MTLDLYTVIQVARQTISNVTAVADYHRSDVEASAHVKVFIGYIT